LQYLILWLGTAVLSASLIGAETYFRTRRIHSGMADEMIRTAVEQFLPSAIAGALISPVLLHYAPGSLWILPGIWQVIFSLGVFSSCRFLPRPVVAVGAFYLMTGLTCIALGDNRALSPWAMGIPFGVGQLLVAAVVLSPNQRDDE
jgi:ABC-type cobalamin transport system permease subunit